jgi:hypothetical protein
VKHLWAWRLSWLDPVGQMMTVLSEFGVRSRIEREDNRQSVENLAKAW